MAKNDSPISWYGNMKPIEHRTFWACFGGWALNSLDFFLFIFAAPAIIVALDMTRQQADFVTTLTLVASALGGWAAGIMADRYGRVRILQITILWFATFGFLCAFAQEYWQLLACRVLMGLGLGGEWAVGAVLLGEVIRAKDRGKAVGVMQCGWAVGWGIVALIAMVVLLKVRQDIAWRLLLSIGLLPALLIFFIRRHVKDAPIFVETQKKLRAKKRTSNFLEIFSPATIKVTLLTTLLAAGAQGGYYANARLLEYLRDNRKIAAMATGKYFAVIIIGSIIGYIISAYLNDRLGRRPTFMLFAACAAASIFALTIFVANDLSVLVIGFFLALFASGTFSGLGPTLTENFPTRVRGSGQSFSYNAGRLIAAGVPGSIAALSARSSFNQSIDVIAIVAYGVVILAAFLLPETKGRTLTADA